MNSTFPKFFSSWANVLFILLLLLCGLFFTKALPIQWMIFSIIEVFSFFHFSHYYTEKWELIPIKTFRRKLFFNALVIRLCWVIFSYYFFNLILGSAFEFHAADSLGYHDEALWALELKEQGNFQLYKDYLATRFSDKGYPLYLLQVYKIFGTSIIIPRIIKAIISAYTCLLIFNIATRNFGATVGKIAGIFAMLLPNFIYYCGLHVKETEMVFLIVAFMDQADILLHTNKYSIKQIITIAALCLAMFTFRTVLATSALIAFLGAFIFLSGQLVNWKKRILTLLWLGGIAAYLFLGKINEEISEYWQNRNLNQSSQMQHFASRQGANQLAGYGEVAIFAPIILFAPFPTLVNIDGQENQMMIAGAYFTRNIYAFFVIIALVALFRQGIARKHLLLIIFMGAYLTILAKSGFALSERFHLPVLPFLLILAAFGVTQFNVTSRRYFNLYMISIVCIILMWNWFKLAGRGIV